jgi:hypothetical protein
MYILNPPQSLIFYFHLGVPINYTRNFGSFSIHPPSIVPLETTLYALVGQQIKPLKE